MSDPASPTGEPPPRHPPAKQTPLDQTPLDQTPLRWLVRLPSLALIGGVRIYQLCLSPLVGNCCRFEPSCSHYFIGAVRKYGAARGAIRGTRRILRCHPWHPGGYDPP